MARISGVDLPRKKRVVVGLTSIFGIGHTTAGDICKQADVDPNIRVENLAETEVRRV